MKTNYVRLKESGRKFKFGEENKTTKKHEAIQKEFLYFVSLRVFSWFMFLIPSHIISPQLFPALSNYNRRCPRDFRPCPRVRA